MANQWERGTKVRAQNDFTPAKCIIGLVKGKTYTVNSHTPKKPIPVFLSERSAYEFWCGQIVPEEYFKGTVWLECGDFLVACDEDVLELVED